MTSLFLSKIGEKMDVEILEFEKRPCKKKIGCLLIRYCELILKCDLVYYPKSSRAWVRMPEVWITREKKLHYCYWPTKEKSDEFQKIVLNKLFEKYSLDLETIQVLHAEGIKVRGSSNISRQNIKK